MTKQECELLVEGYVDWLKKGLSVDQLKDSFELTTPFLDRHNDHLQIYAVRKNDKIILSDDGYILADLRTSGIDIITPKRKAVFESVLNGLGVKNDGRQLSVEASHRNFPQRLHSLVQAMLAINDMFVLAQPRVAGFFWEDVREFFDQNGVRHSPRVKVAGKSGFDHAVDFLIPKSSSRPERFVQAINAPSKSTIGNYLFSLEDIKEARGNGAEAYAFLNDQVRPISGDVLDALAAYEVNAAPWAKKNEFVSALAN